MTDQELNTFLKTIREGVEKTVKGLPMHHDYVKQYCGVKEMHRKYLSSFRKILLIKISHFIALLIDVDFTSKF